MEMQSNEVLDLVSRRFKILADANRLRVLNSLRAGEKNVTGIMEETGLKQANISKILGIFSQAGIVEKRKEGNNAYYRILDESIFALCDLVCSSIEHQVQQLSERLSR